MKNLIAFLISCVSLSALLAQTSSQTKVDVLSDTYDEIVIQISIDGFLQNNLQTPDGAALTLQVDGGTPLMVKGAPDLPKIARLLQIPSTGNMAVEVLESDYTEFSHVQVAPSKGNLKRIVDPATRPYVKGEPYQQDAFYPGALAELKTPFIQRNVRGQSIWLQPLQYNPQRQSLRFYHHFTLRIYATGGRGENEITQDVPNDNGRAFEAVFQKSFLNYRASAASKGADEPEKLLVIAPDAYEAGLEPLLAWKRQSGIHTTFVPLSQIGSNNADQVYQFVSDYYAQHGIQYLLLVGDNEALEPQMRESGGTLYACDNCFGYMSGNDHVQEIFTGRLHAADSAQLAIMVNRILSYEKQPLVDSTANWCATGLASCSNEGQGIGDDNQADYEQGNEWKAKHLTDGFEQYWEFYDGNHSGISPTPGHPSADADGDPTNGPIVDLMNTRGACLYNYTGHGWEQGLASGNFNTDAVANMRNTGRFPILIAVACCTGDFTDNGAGDCLGEAWQRAGNPATGEPWGGIAGFFSSDFQSWAPPMEGQDGMNQYLLDADGINLPPSIGGMALYGNTLMIGAYQAAGEVMADFWN
ncbi:MAG: C25 family cysteine peptidase, partial [Saprospiraceae bacterium]